jgi:hypothetical protein
MFPEKIVLKSILPMEYPDHPFANEIYTFLENKGSESYRKYSTT